MARLSTVPGRRNQSETQVCLLSGLETSCRSRAGSPRAEGRSAHRTSVFRHFLSLPQRARPSLVPTTPHLPLHLPNSGSPGEEPLTGAWTLPRPGDLADDRVDARPSTAGVQITGGEQAASGHTARKGLSQALGLVITASQGLCDWEVTSPQL